MEAKFIETRIDSTGLYICGRTEFTFCIFATGGRVKEVEVTLEGDDGKWYSTIEGEIDLVF